MRLIILQLKITMNILVTGGAGFIGSNIVDAYLQAGHAVVIADDLSTGKIENVNPKAKFHPIDLRDPAVETVFKEMKIDMINHHAAQMDVRKSVADPKFDASVNILGMLNVMELGVKHGVKKVIFSSTGGAIYGEQDYFPADEQHPLRPLSPYGITKLATEKYLYLLPSRVRHSARYPSVRKHLWAAAKSSWRSGRYRHFCR